LGRRPFDGYQTQRETFWSGSLDESVFLLSRRYNECDGERILFCTGANKQSKQQGNQSLSTHTFGVATPDSIVDSQQGSDCR
jgi:hypothetical protein